MGAARYTLSKREAQLIYNVRAKYFCKSIEPLGGIVDDAKSMINCKTGVLIIPKDHSYKRFIRNSWYVDINTDSL